MKPATKVLVNLSLFLLLSLFVHGQVTVGLYPAGAHLQFVDQNGVILSGGKIYTCAAGQVCPGTPLATYTDNTGTVQNTNPIILDSTGSPSNGGVQVGIYLTSAAYKIVAQDVNGVTKWTADNVTSATATSNTTYARLDGTNLPFTANVVLVGGIGTATSLTNFPSRSIELDASYWTGSAAANDRWILQDVLGTGSNPSSTLVVTHVGSPGTSGIQLPPISGGINNGGSGFKHARFASCQTSAVTNGNCIATFTWPAPFIDSNYSVVCMNAGADSGQSGVPAFIGHLGTKSSTGFAYSLINEPGISTAQSTFIDCIAVHD